MSTETRRGTWTLIAMSQGRTWFWLLWLAGATLAALLSLAAVHYDYFSGDIFLAHKIQMLSGPARDLLQIVDHLGYWPVAAIIYALVVAALSVQRLWAEVVVVVLSGPLRAVSSLVKLIVERPRPTEDLVEIIDRASGFSFPSGHALSAILLYGLLIYVSAIVVRRRWLRMAIQTALVLLIVLAGLARINLGAHWPSDVLGGYIIGGLVLALLIKLHRHYAESIRQAALTLQEEMYQRFRRKRGRGRAV